MRSTDNPDPLVHDDSILTIVAEHLGEFIHEDYCDHGPCSECRREAQFLMHKIVAQIRAQVAREVQAAKPTHFTRDYTIADQAWDTAVWVVKGGRPNDGRA